jgi:hypothetical protein
LYTKIAILNEIVKNGSFEIVFLKNYDLKILKFKKKKKKTSILNHRQCDAFKKYKILNGNFFQTLNHVFKLHVIKSQIFKSQTK